MGGTSGEGSFVQRYTDFVLRRPWWVAAGAILVFAVCAAGLPRVQLNDNYRVFFADDNPHLKALEELENAYAKEEVLLFVLAPDDGDVFSRDTLALVEELSKESWQIPLSTRVDSITSFQHTRADGDDIVVSELAENVEAMSEDELAYVRRAVMSEPMLVNRLVSAKGDVTAVAVTFVMPEKGNGERVEPVAVAREMVARFSAEHPNTKIIANGGLIMAHSFSEYSARDLAILTPLQFLVVFIMIAIFMRSIVATLCAIVVILFSVVSAMGLAGWTGLEMTAPTAAMPTIVMTLAVADAIHLLVAMMGAMRSGSDKKAALVESMRVNVGPIVITSLTTVVGFLSMNFNPVPPLQDFGNMTAMGVLAALLYSVTILPAMIVLLPMRVRGNDHSAALVGLGEFVIAAWRPILWGGIVLAIAVGSFSLRNEFTNSWLNWFDEETPFRQDAEFVQARLSGINAIEFSMPAAGPGGVSDPEYLHALEDFSVWVREQPEISHIATLADVMKQVNRSMHGDDPAYYRIPESKELSAQYLLLYEMSLPYGQDLNNQINVDKSATRVTVITQQMDSSSLKVLSNQCEEWLAENAPEYMRTHATGNGPMFASMAEGAIRGMVVGTPAALLFVSLTLIIAFRSLRYGLLSIVPNLVPIIMAYGVWGVLVGRINFGVACVAGLCIGIVVDDTVHFLSKYLRARREQGASAEDAVRYAFSTVGRAMGVTTIVLLGGFFVLAQSAFKFNANMGLLASIAIGIALLADLFLLPAILIAVDGKRHDAADPENAA